MVPAGQSLRIPLSTSIQFHLHRQLVFSWIGYGSESLVETCSNGIATKADIMHLPIDNITFEVESRETPIPLDKRFDSLYNSRELQC